MSNFRPRTALGRSTLFAAAAALMLAAPVEAAERTCGDRQQLIDRLLQQYGEAPQALGLMADGGVIEIFVSPDGGFSMLVTYPNRPTCMVAHGKAWQSLQLAGNPA